MFSCFSPKAVQNSVRRGSVVPPKPPKPGGSKSPLPAQADTQVVCADPPVAPPKPRALQGRDTIGKEKKGEYRSEDKKEVLAMVGPSKGPSCITVPSAREEVSKDGSEKFYAYSIVVKLPSKTHTVKFRFSEISSFHKEWQSMYPGVEIEAPRKMLNMSDEDIAKRCADIQIYLREMCEVSALIYCVSKFLGVDETELKAAIKGRSNATDSSNIVASSPGGFSKSNRALPKVKFDDMNDDRRHSVEKPKLPKVKLAEVESASAREMPSTPPVHRVADSTQETSRSSVPRVTEIKEATPPELPKPLKIEVPSTPKEPTVSTPKELPVASTPKTPKVEVTSTPKASTPVKGNVTPVPSIPPSRKAEPQNEPSKKQEPIKGADSKDKTIPSLGGAGSDKVMSVKERMAAFQKNKA